MASSDAPEQRLSWIFQGAVGGFVLRVVIPVAAVAAVLAGLRALNTKGSGRGGEDRVQTAAAAPADAAPLREAEEQLILEAQEPLEPADVVETAPPPPPEPPVWLQRKVVVCVRDAATREDMTFQLLEDVRCLMTFEVHEDADAVIEMMSAEDAPPMEAHVVYTEQAIASAADGGYGIAFLPRGAIKFPGPDEEIDTEELFVGLCRHCRVLQASTAAGLRAGAVARSRAARRSPTLSPGSKQDAQPAEGAQPDEDRRNGAPPVDELLERVKRERTMSATLSPEVASAGDASGARRGGGERGAGGDNGPARSSSSSAKADSWHAAAASSSSAVQRPGSSLNGRTAGGRGKTGVKRNGSAASHPSRSSLDSGWWRKLPYVVVPVLDYAEDGVQGFVTADLASPGEHKAPHVLAFQDRQDAGAVQAIFLLRASPEDGAEVSLQAMPPQQLEAAAAERDHSVVVFRPGELAVDPHRDGVEDIGRLAYLAARQRN